MNPPRFSSFWQEVARPFGRPLFAFAKARGMGDAGFASCDAASAASCPHICYPSPWSGLLQVRPFFLARQARACAAAAGACIFQFQMRVNAVVFAYITKEPRGSSQCVNPLSFSRFPRFRSPVAFSQTQPQPVQALARFRALLLARSPRTTLLNPLLLAVLPVLLLATRVFAANLAQPVSKFLSKPVAGSLRLALCISAQGVLVRSARSRGESHV